MDRADIPFETIESASSSSLRAMLIFITVLSSSIHLSVVIGAVDMWGSTKTQVVKGVAHHAGLWTT